jgi:hypothetical protein
MARYATGFTTTATAAGAAIADLRTAAGERAYVREIGLFISAATASQIGLYRPSTLGTASTSVTGVPVDPADAAATASIGTAWSVAPAVSTNVPIRKAMIPAAIGNGIIWTFSDRGLVVPVSSSLLLWNYGAGANSVLNGYIEWEE